MSAIEENRPEQPYTGGPLKLRIPFVHYRIEYQDFIQGAILSCVPLGITAAMVKVLGIPIEVAVLMVVINNFLYLLHTSFGDPSVSGWITAGIPLYISYLTGFEIGPERITGADCSTDPGRNDISCSRSDGDHPLGYQTFPGINAIGDPS